MENRHFEVFYLDGLKTGVPEQSAINSLCQIFRLPAHAAKKIILSTQRALKSDLSLEQARKYKSALDRAGLEVEIRDMNPAPTPVESPASGDEALGLVPIEPPPIGPQDLPPQPPPEDALPVEDKGDRMQAIAVQFNGSGLEYFRIWIVNLFLSIVTLGIYSAWAKVRNTQYFYGNTTIDGSSFQYTANPVVILKGRLIAVGFFILYALVNQFLPLLGLLFFLLLLLLIPWIVVRSLAFNARNSVYRNIRFNFTGQVGDAARVFILLPILIPLTLGLILPYIWFRQRQFIISNSSYGSTRFKFHATAGDYYQVFLMLFVILIGGMVTIGLLTSLGQILHPALPIIGAPVMAALYLWLISYHVAAMTNLQFNSSTLIRHSFSMNLETRSIAWLYFTNTLAILLTVGLLIPWAQVRMARYRAECLQLHVAGSLDHFIADEQQHVSALGEQVGDVFDMEVSVL